MPRIALRFVTVALAALGLAGTAAAAPVPASFSPESFTAIGAARWWVLGSTPCSSGRCVAVVRTSDAGRRFTRIAAPTRREASSSPEPGGVSAIAFADGRDGFAYGSGLYATHDGGAHWARIRLGGTVAELVTNGRYVFATLQTGHRDAWRTRLWRSPAGENRWQRLPAAGDVSNGLAVHGSEVVIGNAVVKRGLGDIIGRQLLVSHDDGVSFTRHASPGPGSGCTFGVPAPRVIWGLCSGGHFEAVARSANDGRSFHSAGELGQRWPNGSAFAAASARIAVAGSFVDFGHGSLYRTTNGGRTFRAVGPRGVSWTYVGFTTAHDGVAIGERGHALPQRLYRTTDGGRTFHRVVLG